MSADVRIGDKRLEPHRLRAAILGEVHARPFRAMATPARVLHFGFDTTGDRAQADRKALTELCIARGVTPPRPDDKHFHVTFGGTGLRWEQHSEFTTYTLELPTEPDAVAFYPPAATLATPMTLIPQPGPLLVAVDLHLLKDRPDRLAVERHFNRPSLAVAENSDGTAVYATDFHADADGFVRILVLDRGLGDERAGALVQRLLELETYRTLALLGLPKAQELAPSITRIEQRLAELTSELQKETSLADNNRQLNELTALAAELEAGAAGSLFRFGASRAYDDIVQTRLRIIGERKVAGLPTWSSFLARRMAPAMRTCIATEERQGNLSRKLSRAAQLLRTRVDVEVEQQNRDLLRSMNARTRMQLRLQATVEGLSVAAISYYLVGLFGYLVKGAHDAGWNVDPTLATAAFVPVAVLLIWLTVRRIRSRHMGPHEDEVA
jgi:uncharacterized membrane-anchored protein